LVPITSTVSRSEAAQISSARSAAAGVSSMAQTAVPSPAPPASSAFSMARTALAESTFGTTTAAGPAAAAARTSSSCQGVPAPLMRMVTSRPP
jgi:hypothetical protein